MSNLSLRVVSYGEGCNSTLRITPATKSSQQQLKDRSQERQTPSTLRLQGKQVTAHSSRVIWKQQLFSVKRANILIYNTTCPFTK